MANSVYIEKAVKKLINTHDTRDPFKLCRALDIDIHYKDLGSHIKAYYFYNARTRNIVINNRISKPVQCVLAAHELGHDRLHKDIAMLKSFRQVELFNNTEPYEYEANVFAAELLIADEELLSFLNDEDKSFFGIAKELRVPAELLDFKFRLLKQKGYRIEPPYIANSNFLKNEIDGCFEEDNFC